MSVNIKVTGGLNIEWGQIDPKVTGGLKGRLPKTLYELLPNILLNKSLCIFVIVYLSV